MKFQHNSSAGCRDMALMQTIARPLWTAGAQYRLTFKYKAPFPAPQWDELRVWLRDGHGTLLVEHYPQLQISNITDWKTLIHEFVLPVTLSNADIELMIACCVPVNNAWWVDDVRLEKVPD